MTSKEFDAVLIRRIALTHEVLKKKRKEYANSLSNLVDDRMHNFNRAAAMLHQSREQALIGMLSKHLVSILDIVDKFSFDPPSVEMIEEKIGDAVNYLILLEAMMKEDIKEKTK